MDYILNLEKDSSHLSEQVAKDKHALSKEQVQKINKFSNMTGEQIVDQTKLDIDNMMSNLTETNKDFKDKIS